MKIQFDPKQQYQLDAVSAVVDIFDGQPLEQPEFSVIHQEEDIGEWGSLPWYLCKVLSHPGWGHGKSAFFGKFALFIQASLVSIFVAEIDSNHS